LRTLGLIGGVSPESTALYIRLRGVILGCTQLPVILSQSGWPRPVFDTTALHALAGVDFALSDD
jgi:aspartate racemase